MTYEKALKMTHSLLKFGIKPGLLRMSAIMEKLDNPQEKLKIIHVAGTNGKGSTTAMLSNILISAGYKTGMFTSPYVVDFRERIQINLKFISKAAYARCSEKVFNMVKELDSGLGDVTEFEFITAVAFLYFAEQKCDVAVIETGLGGRLDSTNIIKKPVASVITSISFDHTDILGDTIEKIAYEKCGIIKNDSITISAAAQDDKALAVIFETCAKRNNILYMPSENAVSSVCETIKGISFVYGNEEFKLSMCGSYQVNNALTAIEAARAISKKDFIISEENIKIGLLNAVMPARFEILKSHPIIILDCTHNEDGAKTLFETINRLFKEKKLTAICGMLADKNVDAVAEIMSPVLDNIITVTPENPRAMKKEKLKEIFLHYGKNAITAEISPEIVDSAIKLSKGEPVLVFGSFYVVAPLRQHIFDYINNRQK